MKKEDIINFIREEAYNLAKTGEYRDYLSIEIALRGDGFIEARRVLENDIIRNELDEICSKAMSKEEIQNRESFDNWLKNFLGGNIEQIKSIYPSVTVFVSENQRHFSISSDKKELEMRKEFGTKKLVGDFINEETDGRRYRLFNTYKSKKDFNDFLFQDLIEVVERAI
jgi:hypothetical protein